MPLMTLMTLVVLVPLHLGALHPYERILTVVLAVGPFIPLLIVIRLRQRADDRAEEQQRRCPPD